MKSMQKIISVVMIFYCLSFSSYSNAQCAMCRAGAESNLKSKENNVGKGLNNGILYLMSVPYLMGGVAAIIYFKHRKKN
jgi:hypothetical protein